VIASIHAKREEYRTFLTAAGAPARPKYARRSPKG